MKTALLLNFLFLLLFAGACAYEQEDELFGGPGEDCTEPVVFSTHIAPVIEANCALAGCHGAGAGGVLPELTSFEQIKASAAAVKLQTQSRQMPPPSSGRSLSGEEIRLIACWVNGGAQGD